MKGVLIFLLLFPGYFNRAFAGQNPADVSTSSYRTYSFKDGSSFSYSKPGLFKTLGRAPADFGGFVSDSFKKENLPWLAAITASTLILIEYDQKIYDNTRRFGKKLNISSADKTRTYLKIGGVSLFRGPSDLGSAMYFLGDGWISIGLFGSFEGYGLLKDDWRSARTAHELVEGLLLTGFTTEALKNVAGRETPSSATAPRGVWRLFPGLNQYMKHRTRYDAFPSGHLATAMMSVTVIADNYPEKKYIIPLGYSLVGLLSFQMVNNGVHWVSDYPLGLAIGYSIGKVIAAGGKTVVKQSASANPRGTALRFSPVILPDGAIGPGLAYNF